MQQCLLYIYWRIDVTYLNVIVVLGYVVTLMVVEKK